MATQADHTPTLKALMQRADISSYRQLADLAGVSRWQVQQLRAGKADTMRVSALVQLSKVLQVSLSDLLAQFGVEMSQHEAPIPVFESAEALQQEYRRLQQQTVQQLAEARSHFQSESLRTLETWLVQWPTIAQRARESGADLAAAKILPFVRPVETLVAEWGVEAIALVNSQVPYDPQYHQLIGTTADPGELVTVTHSGAIHNGKLLYRAKVKTVPK